MRSLSVWVPDAENAEELGLLERNKGFQSLLQKAKHFFCLSGKGALLSLCGKLAIKLNAKISVKIIFGS